MFEGKILFRKYFVSEWRERRNSFRNCYISELIRNPRLSETISISFTKSFTGGNSYFWIRKLDIFSGIGTTERNTKLEGRWSGWSRLELAPCPQASLIRCIIVSLELGPEQEYLLFLQYLFKFNVYNETGKIIIKDSIPAFLGGNTFPTASRGKSEKTGLYTLTALNNWKRNLIRFRLRFPPNKNGFYFPGVVTLRLPETWNNNGAGPNHIHYILIAP